MKFYFPLTTLIFLLPTLSLAEAPVSEPNPVFQFQREFQPQQYVDSQSPPPPPPQPSQPQREDDSFALLGVIQMLQEEVRELRGRIEIQGHEIQLLKERLDNPSKVATTEEQQNSTNIFVRPKVNQEVDPWLAELTHDIPAQTATVAVPDDPQEVFQSAYQLLQQNNYAKAQTDFEAFIQNYPNHEKVPDAHYWLGEIALLNSNDELALQHFSTIENDYPNHPRLPEALLKLGTLYDQMGDATLAKEYYQSVQRKAPHSTAARLAIQRLRD